VPDFHRAEGAPIALGTLAGGQRQCEESRLPRGSDGAYIRLDQRIAAVKALLTQALDNLGSGRGIALQHPDHLRFERIEFTRTLPRFPGPEALLGEPGGDSAWIEGQRGGNLRGAQSLLLMEVFALAETSVINPDNTSQMCLNTALRSTGSLSPARGASSAVGLRASPSRAKTW
jgi:hypothetical protein